MTNRQTEDRHPAAEGLDLLPPEQVLRALADGQVAAAKAVDAAIPQLALAARLAANSLEGGGRLIYAAAGSSGLMALADALELPGTYGVAKDRVVVLLAGGEEALVDLRGGPEDDAQAAVDAVRGLGLNRHDCLIALTASGHTPYPLAAVREARHAGAGTIGLANNAGAPLFDLVDVAVCLATPPEVVAGSTRMGAGTSQKIALNMLSTMMAIHLGHVHDGFMVNVVADNAKLRERARGMVANIAGVAPDAAGEALARSAGAVKPAVLMAAGVPDLDTAKEILSRHGGHLRPALAELGASTTRQ